MSSGKIDNIVGTKKAFYSLQAVHEGRREGQKWCSEEKIQD